MHFLSDNNSQAPCICGTWEDRAKPGLCLSLLCEVRQEGAAPQKVLSRPLRPARNHSKAALSLWPRHSWGSGSELLGSSQRGDHQVTRMRQDPELSGLLGVLRGGRRGRGSAGPTPPAGLPGTGLHRTKAMAAVSANSV